MQNPEQDPNPTGSPDVIHIRVAEYTSLLNQQLENYAVTTPSVPDSNVKPDVVRPEVISCVPISHTDIATPAESDIPLENSRLRLGRWSSVISGTVATVFLVAIRGKQKFLEKFHIHPHP